MHLAQEIMKAGGTIAKGKALMAVKEDGVVVKDTHSNEETMIPADTVVLAMGVRSQRPDYEELKKEFGPRLILVGDSDRPGQIYDALHSGHDRAFVYGL
jgi:2,4-dienoyl-CoA reductase (NADPH2)